MDKCRPRTKRTWEVIKNKGGQTYEGQKIHGCFSDICHAGGDAACYCVCRRVSGGGFIQERWESLLECDQCNGSDLYITGYRDITVRLLRHNENGTDGFCIGA